MVVKKCVFCHHDETIKHLFFQCRSIRPVIQLALALCQPNNVPNIFGNWLNGVDRRFKKHIRVGAIVVIWTLWLCRNDKLFNDKTFSHLHVIYWCINTLRLWSSLKQVESRDLFMEVYSQLEATAMGTFSQYGCHHNLWIGPPMTQAILQFLDVICNIDFFI
jgi:hypothetical protein